jgi:hypothetical protein
MAISPFPYAKFGEYLRNIPPTYPNFSTCGYITSKIHAGRYSIHGALWILRG